MSDGDTPMADMDTDKMAEFTRKDADKRPLEEGEAVGSHGFPADAPASDMARRRVHPAHQRDAEDDTTVTSED